jgi:hypothetical protein
MLNTVEQEDFMHRIYDVIHNGISMCNLKFALENLKERFGNLSSILNTRMKNEKYSSFCDFPIMKVIFENQSNIMSVSNDQFIERKLVAIKLLQSYGAHLNILNEKYKGHDINWLFYVQSGQVPMEIYDQVINSVKDDKITIKI